MKMIAVVFVLIFAFCGCDNSSEPSLEERFSCKVDGKLWVADDENGWTGYQGVNVRFWENSENTYFLFMDASNKSKKNPNQAKEGGMSFTCDTLHGLNSKGKLKGEFYIYTGTDKLLSQWQDYKIQNGEIILHSLDSDSKIVQGTFQFEAKDTSGNIIKVTEGRFNTTYQY